jgi:hypothetical protein
VSLKRADSQNPHACKIGKGIQFRFQVDPGRYVLDVGLLPFRQSVHVIVSGASGASQSFEVFGKKGEGSLPVDINGAGTLNIEVDGIAQLRWLTLTQAVSGITPEF